MCTLTWHDEPDRYEVFFNRDERRERKPELPPAIRRRGGTRFIAPLDGDFGGTWIAVNERGLSICLLNGFPANRKIESARDYRTRGDLPLKAIEFHSVDEAAGLLHSLDLEPYRPFALVLFEPGGVGLTASWSGVALELREGRPSEQPLVSSSFFTEQVRENRRTVFRDLGRTCEHGAPLHLAFHASHLPASGPHSPCMHRSDASTVSFSRIEVDAQRIRFYYVPHPPCQGLPREPVSSLERSASSSSRTADRSVLG